MLCTVHVVLVIIALVPLNTTGSVLYKMDVVSTDSIFHITDTVGGQMLVTMFM